MADKPDDRLLIRSQKCAACGATPCDPAHIKTIAAGAGNAEFEMMPLCRLDHQTQHSKGWKYMADNYPSVKIQLAAKGWVFDSIFLKWTNNKH